MLLDPLGKSELDRNSVKVEICGSALAVDADIVGVAESNPPGWHVLRVSARVCIRGSRCLIASRSSVQRVTRRGRIGGIYMSC